MKKTKPLPPSIEMLYAHYETFIQKNTVMVYKAWIEPDRCFENGEPFETSYDSVLEIRMVPGDDLFYIYSSFTGKLWSTRSLDEANLILKREEKYCNRRMKDINETERKDSVERFIKQTEPLLISAQNIIKGNSPNSN